MTGAPCAAARAAYEANGWAVAARALPGTVVAPVQDLVRDTLRKQPRQDLLSGVHNPFGQHACVHQAWQFLDLAESPALLDAVEAVLGPDIVLWDSELHADAAPWPRDEALCWPADPLAGTVVLVDLDTATVTLADITRLATVFDDLPRPAGPFITLRYMPATSRYNRDPRFAPNRRAAIVRPLVNHCIRPIWLVRGADRAGSDFAAGFAPPAARWAGTPTLSLDRQ